MFRLKRKRHIANKSEIPKWFYAADPKKTVLAIDEHYCPQCDQRLGDTQYRFDDTDIRLIDISYYDKCNMCGGCVDHFEDWPIEDIQHHTLNKVYLVSLGKKHRWFNRETLEPDNCFIIKKIDDNTYLIDPKFENQGNQWCYVHSDEGTVDYDEADESKAPQALLYNVYGFCDGLDYVSGEYDPHALQRTTTYINEDRTASVMNKLDLIDRDMSKKRHGLFARIFRRGGRT